MVAISTLKVGLGSELRWIVREPKQLGDSKGRTWWGRLFASPKYKLVVLSKVKQSIPAEVRPQTWVVLLICEKRCPSGDSSRRLIPRKVHQLKVCGVLVERIPGRNAGNKSYKGFRCRGDDGDRLTFIPLTWFSRWKAWNVPLKPGCQTRFLRSPKMQES